MRNFLLILLCLIASAVQGLAQPLTYSEHFSQKMTAAGLSLAEPLDAGYQSVPVQSNDFQKYDYAIQSGSEDLEIRYFILPWSETDTLSMYPDVLCLRASTAVATNDEEAVISMLPISSRELRETFGADWGIIYFFRPKSGFAPYAHCRMLALHKAGVGTALVFFLFDNPNNPAIDQRYEAIRFAGE